MCSFETNEAKLLYEVNGNLKVPREYKTIAGHKLNPWLCRRKREQDCLSTDQIAALTAIGMNWTGKARSSAMTCKLNPNLKKIQSSLTVIIDGTEKEYRNGEELTGQVFEKSCLADSITARSNRIIIHL